MFSVAPPSLLFTFNAFWETAEPKSHLVLLALRSQSKGLVGEEFPAHRKGGSEQSESTIH